MIRALELHQEKLHADSSKWQKRRTLNFHIWKSYVQQCIQLQHWLFILLTKRNRKLCTVNIPKSIKTENIFINFVQFICKCNFDFVFFFLQTYSNIGFMTEFVIIDLLLDIEITTTKIITTIFRPLRNSLCFITFRLSESLVRN